MVGRQYGGYVQRGRGDFPVFRGSRMQRGYGLGSVLSGMFRTAIPFLKSGVKALGKEALRTGVNIGQDVLSGQNFKTAAQPKARKGIKRKANGKSVTSSRGKRGKGPKRSPDIFDR